MACALKVSFSVIFSATWEENEVPLNAVTAIFFQVKASIRTFAPREKRFVEDSRKLSKKVGGTHSWLGVVHSALRIQVFLGGFFHFPPLPPHLLISFSCLLSQNGASARSRRRGLKHPREEGGGVPCRVQSGSLSLSVEPR